MKTLFIFLSLASFQETISQSLDSALAFYPLHLGDTWTYDYRLGYNPSVHGWFYTLTVVGDTTAPTGNTYTILREQDVVDTTFTVYQYVRVDSSTACVYVPTNFETWTEYMSDSLLAQKGDRSGMDQCCEIFQDTILGFPTTVKYFIHNPFWSHSLAYGLGTTYQYSGNTLRGQVETILVYARIAGREFGIPVSVPTNKTQPLAFSLSPNYPNPFNPSTNILYSVDKAGFVSIEVFNAIGQHIITLVSSFKYPGQHVAHFNAERLSSGIYYYVLNAEGRRVTKSMILLK